MTTRSSPHESLELPIEPEWLALRTEAPLEPALPIIDAHHHLWDRPGRRYLHQDILADLATGHNVVATVHVQGRAMYRAGGPAQLRPVGETEFVNGVAAMSASGIYGRPLVCAGIVGFADLRLGAAATDVLEAHLRAGGERFRGVRHITAWDADPLAFLPAYAPAAGLLGDAKFREGFSRLAPLGLSFDAWLLSSQIDELVDLARAFPETTIILDHLGTPLGVGSYATRRPEVFDAWRGAVQRLSDCSNVRIKLGGLGQGINGFRWSEASLPPASEDLAAAFQSYFEVCIDAFSPDRCMLESNFPVDKGSYGYATFWNACKRVTQSYSQSDRAALFFGTAADVYRLQAAVAGLLEPPGSAA